MEPNLSPSPQQPDLPALYIATDTAAKSHQRWFIASILIEIGLTLLGAFALVLGENPDFVRAVGPIASVQVRGGAILPLSLATAVTLFATALTLGARYFWKPSEKWRQCRFLGEQCATLAWRYVTKATPVDLGRGQGAFTSVNNWYLDQIDKLLLQAKPLDLPDVNKEAQLTSAMITLRDGSLAQRFAVYLKWRASDQRDYYETRAREYRNRRNWWRFATIAVYIVGALVVVAHATQLRTTVPFGLLGANYWPVVAAAASAITGYVAARHYDDLQQTYGYMCGRLTAEINIMNQFDPNAPQAEADFAESVDRVETLMDAEHTQWHKSIK